MIQIKHRFTCEVLKEVDAADLCGANLRDADLCGADLRGADLRGADLRYADLCDADLRGADLRYADLRYADLCDADLCDADLRGANLCGEKLKSAPVFIYGLKWLVIVTNEFLTIGCQRHTHAEWTSFSDETIKDMHFSVIDFWRQWKPVLLSVCAIQSAVKQRSLQEPSPRVAISHQTFERCCTSKPSGDPNESVTTSPSSAPPDGGAPGGAKPGLAHQQR